MTNRIALSDIKIGSRFRKDFGDIQALAESINEIGLLHPIVINQTNELIAGARRLEAWKSLGRNKIPVTVVPIDDIIKGEFYENSARKDFSFSERIAILEEVEKQRIGHRVSNEKGANLAPFQKQEKGKKSRDIAARYMKISPAQLQKEKKIIQSIRDKPEKYGELLQKLDNGKVKINKAYRCIARDELVEERMMKSPQPPVSIILNERGDFKKTYAGGVCSIEPPPEKWRVQNICSELNTLEAKIKFFTKEYQKKIEELRRLETELKLCVLYPKPRPTKKTESKKVTKEQQQQIFENNLPRLTLIHGDFRDLT